MIINSACLTGVQKIEVRKRDLALSDDQVLVKTHATGICGSDKNLYNGIIPPSGGLNSDMKAAFSYPYFFGHEAGGIVVEVGKNIRNYKPGDKVMAFAWVETYSDYFAAREEELEPVPQGLSMDLASLGEPIGCAVFSGLSSKVQLGDTVAVIGMGFAGQVIAQVAKQKGAHKVIGVDVVEGKLKLAESLGLDHAVNSSKTDPLSAILDLTNGEGADVMVEVAGTGGAVQLCNDAVKHNGTLVFYSWVTQDIKLNISRWHNNSLTVVNTGLVHHGIMQRHIWVPQAIRPVLLDQIKIEPLITHSYHLDKIDQAMETANNDPAAVKVMIRP
ncbi:MAG: zinc-binding dehydrogenase [Desulfobacula sp.]|jgi:threonine dehydrogenase-like Zn-dependent dehydrogenase|uniref:zinc-dependent alcohol dehydrogenase n=1 Tax=Desulfobacula sp. TaxID=2593537 RepID=UPI001DCA86FD|nr:zinc-binding dehydrogenase [Desulfobacula sp.]MBT3483747.1 zinc-binding dehydrogenase [Desulfobacula sp.]MBT3803475.1 zinc-binding dehydrogenase [Desulfobacula sp.]MBT4023270.1 zinc-binding dehydrogenase [Desulfobacula sp.]MBT4197256.1 zinc-binding dehydrogenase [Desulfobacula sp.]